MVVFLVLLATAFSISIDAAYVSVCLQGQQAADGKEEARQGRTIIHDYGTTAGAAERRVSVGQA
jgi:hypothetical protein